MQNKLDVDSLEEKAGRYKQKRKTDSENEQKKNA